MDGPCTEGGRLFPHSAMVPKSDSGSRHGLVLGLASGLLDTDADDRMTCEPT